MNESKKVIAFDLDGTLTESKQALTKDMAQALMNLSQQKKVVIISGGSIEQYKKQFLPYFTQFTNPENNNFNNLILMPTSGTEWYQYNQSQKIWELTNQEKFPNDIKKKAIEILEEMVASDKYDIPNESFGKRIEDRGSQITLSALGQDAPLEKKKIWDRDQKKRQIMKADFEAKMPEVSVSIGGTTSIDILPKGFTKAVGLDLLLKKLGYEHSDLLYVGDALFPGGNDYSAVEAHFDVLQVASPAETLLNIQNMIVK